MVLSEIDSDSSDPWAKDDGQGSDDDDAAARCVPHPDPAAAAATDNGDNLDNSRKNPMDVELEGTPLSVLFGRAAKLKSAQSAPSRSDFDSYPVFYRNTIYPDPEVEEARGGHSSCSHTKTFEERMDAATKIKEEGNDCFRRGQYEEASGRYGTAAAVFRYLENTNPNWKTEGIRDECTIRRFDRGSNPSERRSITSFLVSCYTNIALASLRTGQGDGGEGGGGSSSASASSCRVAVDACNEALALMDGGEPSSSSSSSPSPGSSDGGGGDEGVNSKARAKALYLRAKARLAPLSAGAAEQESALRDLIGAVKEDPENGTVRKELTRLRRSTRAQRLKDRTAFRGLFERGEIYREEDDGEGGDNELNKTAVGGDDDGGDSATRGKNGRSSSGETTPKKTYTVGETLALADLCRERGMREEERKLRELVEADRKRAATAGARAALLDFRNPTAEMREGAERMGVDLTDPGVVDMLEELQRTKSGEKAGGRKSRENGRTAKRAEGSTGADGGGNRSALLRRAVHFFRSALERWMQRIVPNAGTTMAFRPCITALVLVVAIRAGSHALSSR